MHKTTNYPLASAGRRIMMRICDYLVIVICFIGITLCMTWFCFESDFEVLKYNYHTLFSGMLLLAHVISLFIWWVYYILIPRFCHGFTLFGYVFKLKIVWTESHKLFSRLFKFQGFDVVFLFAVMLIFYTTTFAFDNPVLYIQNTFSFNGMTQADSNMKMLSSIFISLYVIGVFPILGVFVNTLMNNHCSNFIDDWTDLFLAHLKTPPEKITPPKVESTLPGLIDIKELEQL